MTVHSSTGQQQQQQLHSTTQQRHITAHSSTVQQQQQHCRTTWQHHMTAHSVTVQQQRQLRHSTTQQHHMIVLCNAYISTTAQHIIEQHKNYHTSHQQRNRVTDYHSIALRPNNSVPQRQNCSGGFGEKRRWPQQLLVIASSWMVVRPGLSWFAYVSLSSFFSSFQVANILQGP